MINYSIQHLPIEERPRERLLRRGPEALATAELVAIILGSGMKGKPVLQLAHEIIMHFGGIQGVAEATVQELRAVKGLGQAKALQLKAACSLSQRMLRQASPPKFRIEHPIQAYHLVRDELEKEKRELFGVILQDTKGYVIIHQVVAVGTLSRTLVHPREVFYPAIRHSAASLILIHNHPSGDPTPSQEDYEVTRTLLEVGRLMGIPVHDHIIVGSENYVSLRQRGMAF